MFLFLFTFLIGLGFVDSTVYTSIIPKLSPTNGGNESCPLNFEALRELVIQKSHPLTLLDVATECLYVLEGYRMVRSVYLHETGFFYPPSSSSNACWSKYQLLSDKLVPEFDIKSTCGLQNNWVTETCLNITTKSQFESLIPKVKLREITRFCNNSLEENSSCSMCKESLSSVQATYFNGSKLGNSTDCTGYPLIYAAAIVNRYGPTDKSTIKCLFTLNFNSPTSSGNKYKFTVSSLVKVCAICFLGIVFVVWFSLRRCKYQRKMTRAKNLTSSISKLNGINENISLVEFTLDEIKQATNNLSWENVIGKGQYGNVYKGVLPNGSEVAMKRLKNCSALADSSFIHEVEVIASIRHVNLLSLRGYCTTNVSLESHHRIIVCDLMKNGSLYDHLFGRGRSTLSWPIRKKIAIGMARGLAYLHHGAQPAIIHRDIKPSNILLDETYEPKLADFGLAKYTLEGISHLGTKLAGTLGYVAPEYALYGQLTERSDVYGFGVVLLELLSGKKAVILDNDEQISLLTDWAWALVREGRALEVVEETMGDLGPEEEMERYVLVGVISSHPLLYARPTMDQIVRILERNADVPSIMDRPFSPLTEIDGVSSSRNDVKEMSFSVHHQLMISETNNQNGL